MFKRKPNWEFRDGKVGLIQIAKSDCPDLQQATIQAGRIKQERLLAVEQERQEAEMEIEAVSEVKTMEKRKKDRVQELINSSRTLGTTENVIYNQHAQRVEQELGVFTQRLDKIEERLAMNVDLKSSMETLKEIAKFSQWASELRVELQRIQTEVKGMAASVTTPSANPTPVTITEQDQ